MDGQRSEVSKDISSNIPFFTLLNPNEKKNAAPDDQQSLRKERRKFSYSNLVWCKRREGRERFHYNLGPRYRRSPS
jgi:hypothetical protein